MSLEELLAVDFRDSASLKASRRKRMARQRRPVGSYFALPGPFLPSVAPPCPSSIPRVRIAFLLLSSSKSDALLARTFEVMDMSVCYIQAIGEGGLRFILRKELRNSDVSSLGRIVLPKVSLWASCYQRIYELAVYC